MAGERAGDVSSGWPAVRLGDVCQIQLGKMLSPKSKTGARSRPYLRNANVQWGRFDLADVAEMDFDEREETKFALRPGDLLVCEGGEPGRSAVWDGQMPGCLYQKALHRLRPDPQKADPSFLMYRLWLGAFTGEFDEANAKTTIAHLPAVRLQSLLVRLPVVERQQEIVARLRLELAEVERAQAAAEAQRTAAQDLSIAELRTAFGSDAIHDWPRWPLGEVSEIVSGVTLGRKLGDGITRRVPYVRVANVKDGSLDLADVYEIEATDREIRKLRLQRGDLLLTEGGDPDKLGRGTCWQDELPECIHQNHIFRVRLNREVLIPEFVSAQIGSKYGKAYFLAHAKQTTGIATINQGVLARFPVLSPPLDVQRRVIARLKQRLTEAGRILGLVGRATVEIDGLPAALLRRAFSGEL